MAYLFIDTSDHLVLGLLDENYRWLDFVETEDKKSSASIHSHVYSLLEKRNLKIKEVQGLFQVAGPGSYTGMRISEGMAQVLEWQDIPIYSFYHFSVPFILGIERGAWVSKAFKGEIFLYEWRGEKVEKSLHSEKDLGSLQEKLSPELGEFWTHFDGVIDQISRSSAQLIKEKPEEVFSYVAESQLREKPFYYRSLENEFHVSNK
ncbi:hypothetical protein [Halobacteriovorax marinus]|uniref:hypothetical protein n=1 Tax=Halobacteriovorax marinus TaxID=97084 RepID=UPI003A90C2A6